MNKKEIGTKITFNLPLSEEDIEKEVKKIYAKMPLWKKIILFPFILLNIFSAIAIVKIFESEMESEKK